MVPGCSSGSRVVGGEVVVERLRVLLTCLLRQIKSLICKSGSLMGKTLLCRWRERIGRVAEAGRDGGRREGRKGGRLERRERGRVFEKERRRGRGEDREMGILKIGTDEPVCRAEVETQM